MKKNLFKKSGIKSILFTLAVGICLLGAGHTARADDYAYFTAAGGLFGTLDLTTGKTVGSTFYLGYAPTSGIGVANGTLYNLEMVGSISSLVHSIDPVAQTTSALYYTLFGKQYPPIGSANNVLYTISATPLSSNLKIRYDLTSIATSDTIGGPIMIIDDPHAYVWGLSNSSSALYFSLADTLYTVDTSGALVGSVSMAPGLGIGSMVFENGTLYGAGSGGNIYTINTATGATNLLSNSGFDIIGLAPAPGPSSTPEPATMLLLGLGLMGVLGIRRKIKK